MHRSPDDELRDALSLVHHDTGIDNQTATRLRKTLAEEFRSQLTIGVPTDSDEKGLRRLARQIKAKKVCVKLFLRHPLHDKLYLLFRPDPVNPSVGFVGSSNLTFAGLAQQGELNVDVMVHDSCEKLAKWGHSGMRLSGASLRSRTRSFRQEFRSLILLAVRGRFCLPH